MLNGRVADIDLKVSPMYPRTDYKPDHTFSKDATRGIHNSNPLSELFFSDKNIAAIQHGIRYTVWLNSCQKHVIGTQSEDEIKIVMRSIYLQYSKNQPFNILEQVRELNGKVLEFCVERIMNEIVIYSKYKKDLASLPDPMERSVNTSSRGSRVLELKEF